MCQSVPQPSTTTIKKIVFDDSSPKASVTKENRSPVFAQRFSPCQTRVRRRGPGNGHSRQTLKPAALRRIVLTLLIEQPSCWTMLFEQILFCMVNCLGYYIAGWYIQWLQTPGSGSIASNPLGGCFFFPQPFTLRCFVSWLWRWIFPSQRHRKCWVIVRSPVSRSSSSSKLKIIISW